MIALPCPYMLDAKLVELFAYILLTELLATHLKILKNTRDMVEIYFLSLNSTGGSDYMRLNDVLTDELFVGETRKCVAFTIISDDVIEDAESFNVSLTTDAEFASLLNTVAVVNIAGELGECVWCVCVCECECVCVCECEYM